MERTMLRRLSLHGMRFRRGLAPTAVQCRLLSSSSPGRVASRRLYRILQRQCIDLKNTLPSNDAEGETMLLLQPALQPSQSGTHRKLAIKTVAPEDDIRNLLVFFRDWNEDNEEKDAHDWFATINPDNDDWDDFTDEPTLWVTASSIQKTIRHAFRNARSDDRKMMNKYAIRVVQMLMEQAEMLHLSSISFDRDVRVVATSKHIGSSHMGPPRGGPRPKNRFNYRIRIENLSDQDYVMLLGRRWLIEDLGLPDEQVPEEEQNPIVVDAPNSGAVGQLPVLGPGDAFEYMSGCELSTSRGAMQGCFHLAPVPPDAPSATVQNTVPAFHSPDRFEVQVKPFPLEATRG